MRIHLKFEIIKKKVINYNNIITWGTTITQTGVAPNTCPRPGIYIICIKIGNKLVVMHSKLTFKTIKRIDVPQLPRGGGAFHSGTILLKHSAIITFMRKTRPAFPDLRDEFESLSMLLHKETS